MRERERVTTGHLRIVYSCIKPQVQILIYMHLFVYTAYCKLLMRDDMHAHVLYCKRERERGGGREREERDLWPPLARIRMH